MALFKEPINWHTFWLCTIISFAQLIGAYESVIIGTTYGKADFMMAMSLWDSEGNETHNFSSLQGAITCLYQAGAFCGSIFVSVVIDRWGRKIGLLFGCLVSIPGMIGLTASMNATEFMIFRFITGFGTWAAGVCAAAYVPELAPPAYRGFFAGLNGVMIGAGVCLGSYVGMAFYFSDNLVAQWRAPLGIALLIPILVICAIPFLPESPRWLLLQDRPEEARRIFDKLNAIPSGDTSMLEAEFTQMQQQASYDRTLDSSWKCFLTHPVYRKRAYIACVLSFFAQSTGVFVINNYGQTFYRALGFSPADCQILQGNRDLVAFIGNLLGSWIIDRVGRRVLLLAAFTGCFVCITIEAIMVALYAHSDNTAGKNTGVAFLYIFLLFYASGVDVGTYVVLGEMFPNHLRTKGVGISLATLNATATIYLSVTSRAFAAIGWKYFLVFVAMTLFAIGWIFFTIPETRGLPLEEIEALFGNPQDTVIFISPHGREINREMGGEEKGMTMCVENTSKD